MISQQPRGALVGALLVIVALLAPGAAQAATYAPCKLSLADHDPPGRTSAYDLTVAKRRTTCATAKKVMRAFHRCRTESSYRCPRKVLGAWRCTGRKRATTLAHTYRGSFTCRRGLARVRSGYLQNTPRCFGAAARDPLLRCFSRTRTLSPGLGVPDPDMTWVCDPGALPGACTFGVAEHEARGRFALIGDSHVQHWRTAFSAVIMAERWRGYSISAGGCFFSAAVGGFQPGCVSFYNEALSWLRDHPEVDTVFVTQNADTPVGGNSEEENRRLRIAGFKRAYRALPRSVKHLVVLRDTTISTQATLDCAVAAARSRSRRLAPVCPLSRRTAIREDHAIQAVEELNSERYAQIDLTRYLCSRGSCYPIVGGTLVNGDVWGHLNNTFSRTLGPYLLRELRRLRAAW